MLVMTFSTFQIMPLHKGSICHQVIHETIEFVGRSEQLNTCWLDLYCAGTSDTGVLHHNDGEGPFNDGAAPAGGRPNTEGPA